MAIRSGTSAGIFVSSLLAAATALGQTPEPPARDASDALRLNEALLMLDYQVLRVAGDKPIDLIGFHVFNKVADRLYFGAGFYAPLVKGVYGGFTAYDIAAHAKQRLSGPFFATAGLSAGGGAGGRSAENAKSLTGTGSFYKASVGLGRDFGSFSAGVNLARMKFSHSAIGSTQANVFLEVPYTYLTGPFSSHGQALSSADARRAAEESPEKMLTLTLDNFRQQNPQGSFKGVFNVADFQYAQYFARDTYWYADFGVGYRGLPLYNHVMGGLGERVRLSPRVALYGQLGVGSGGYAPDRLDTDAGLVVYPKVSAEYLLTQDLGLALSAGYLVAPKGTSKNLSVGLALTHHIGNGDGRGSSGQGTRDTGSAPTYQAFRVSLFQQTDLNVRFRDVDRGRLKMIGVQVDAILDDRWYIPLQGAVAYSTYLGYPGYGEVLAGLGLQTRADPGERWQAFGELMAGTNVHGLAAKVGTGLRYVVNDRTSLHLAVGRLAARSAGGNRFTTDSLSLGLDYRFSLPVW